MSIVSTVRDLSDALSEGMIASCDDDEINAWLKIIGSMSEYPEDLGEWEVAVQRFSFSNEQRVAHEKKYLLALDIFEFGRLNMYSVINIKKTEREYSALCQQLNRFGVTVDDEYQVKLSTWF